jgi:F0F1-type ATP synthase membrane subunit b/b'
MDAARRESERIRAGTEKTAAEMEKKAKKNLEKSVDEVVEATVRRMKTSV